MKNLLNLDIPKVRAMIDHIMYIMSVEKPTFAEWKFVMSWIDCEHEYEMGAKSSMDFLKSLGFDFEKLIEIQRRKSELYK